MYKSVRMNCREAHSKCKTLAIAYYKGINYESIVNGMRAGHTKYGNDEELEFALFIKAKSLEQFYNNEEFKDYFDPASQYEMIKYGYVGCLEVSMSNGTNWPCYVYTDFSYDQRDKFLEFSVLRMRLTEVPDVTEVVAALKKGDDSVLRNMVDERQRQL